jgi:ABC-2 type transport system permease protein
MEYRANFILGFICELSWLVVNLAFFNIVYLNINQIYNWSKYQILLLVTISALFDNLMTLLFQHNLYEIPSHIKKGTLDFLLLKPFSNRFLLSIKNFCIPQIINIMLNTILVIYFINKLHIDVSAGKILIFSLLLLNGIFVLYNLFFLIMIMSFWFIDTDVNVLMFYQLFHIGNKPLDIVNPFLQKIFIYIVPVYIAFNFPVIYITKKLNIYNLILPFIISVFLFWITQIIFEKAINRYSSASS